MPDSARMAKTCAADCEFSFVGCTSPSTGNSAASRTSAGTTLRTTTSGAGARKSAIAMSTRRPARIDAYVRARELGKGSYRQEDEEQRGSETQPGGTGENRGPGGDERPEDDDVAHVGIDPRQTLELVR